MDLMSPLKVFMQDTERYANLLFTHNDGDDASDTNICTGKIIWVDTHTRCDESDEEWRENLLERRLRVQNSV